MNKEMSEGASNPNLNPEREQPSPTQMEQMERVMEGLVWMAEAWVIEERQILQVNGTLHVEVDEFLWG